MILDLFRRRKQRLAPVDALFARVAEAARRPWLYLDAGIPDDFEGRFEALSLHMFLVMRRLGELPAPAADLSQDLVDACFAYLELGLRNGGVSDIAVPKRMKKIAQMFYGRIQAYEAASITGDPAALDDALKRNAGVGEAAPRLGAYVRAAQARLARFDLDGILAEPQPFPAEEDSHGR